MGSTGSVRVGFITAAYDKGVRDEDIMRHTRHRAATSRLSRTGWDAIAAELTVGADRPKEGEGGSPHLTLARFGPLDDLLSLARAQKIDLAEIPLVARQSG